MKQIIYIVIALMATSVANANYTTLSFRNVGGEVHHLEITGLEITFTKDNLIASNMNTSISIPLEQLDSMEFSDASSPGAVTTVNIDNLTGNTTVYTLNGVEIGTFASFADAMAGLSKGMYLFKYTDGTTLKIVKE